MWNSFSHKQHRVLPSRGGEKKRFKCFTYYLFAFLSALFRVRRAKKLFARRARRRKNAKTNGKLFFQSSRKKIFVLGWEKRFLFSRGEEDAKKKLKLMEKVCLMKNEIDFFKLIIIYLKFLLLRVRILRFGASLVRDSRGEKFETVELSSLKI